jgi:predicted nucleic acid-binding Zn ribbon protein
MRNDKPRNRAFTIMSLVIVILLVASMILSSVVSLAGR